MVTALETGMRNDEGLQSMRAEMARECADALATLDGNRAVASRIVESIRRTGQLVLYAMGGSHYVNAVAAPLYRDGGIDCRAMLASDALMAPLPDGPRTALIASQSGESGEIVELLARSPGAEERYGLTLNADSTLGIGTRGTLLAAGGPELAFAATRSIILTIALHAAVLEALGQPQDALRAVFASGSVADIAAADAALANCDVVVFVGRHALSGVAQSGALSMMELARVPTIGLEAGQFRHGPYEMLRPGLGVVLLRSAGPDSASIPPIAASTIAAGCATVVFDASGEVALPGCATVTLPPAEGLAAAAHMLLAFQPLNIAVACRRIAEHVGTPLRTSKVTA
jgi:fructoselysine-6-P-deglycase FrlB-like protein